MDEVESLIQESTEISEDENPQIYINENGARLIRLRSKEQIKADLRNLHLDWTDEQVEAGMLNEREYTNVWGKNRGISSPKKRFASQINAYSNIKDKNSLKAKEKFIELINSPQISAQQILKLQQELLQSENLSERNKISLLRALADCHRTLFGQNVNIAAGYDFEQNVKTWFDRRKEMMQEENTVNNEL